MKWLAATMAVTLLCWGCGDDSDDTSAANNSGGASASSSSSGAGGSGGNGGSGGMACGPDDAGPNEDLGGGPDPAGGSFTLAEALEGLPQGDGPLRAILTTEVGEITCTFEVDAAPIAVANFVGLARGRRPWRDASTQTWVKRRFYDGLIFHRIIDDFMAQGGDPLGTGYGGPGYSIPDEVGILSHTPGTLSYANSGPNSSGSQFFITEIATTNLDAEFTIFGRCAPMAVIQALTAVETTGPNGMPANKPLVDQHISSLEITRCPL